MTDWQPIETAPKDGTTILGWGRYNEDPVTVRWWTKRRIGGWQPVYDRAPVIESMSDFGTDYKEEEILTHWQPLPKPPAIAD